MCVNSIQCNIAEIDSMHFFCGYIEKFGLGFYFVVFGGLVLHKLGNNGIIFYGDTKWQKSFKSDNFESIFDLLSDLKLSSSDVLKIRIWGPTDSH